MSSRHLVSGVVSAINVAINSNFSSVVVRRSKFILNIIDVLYVNGFIKSYMLIDKNILITFKYQNSKSVISKISIVSRPRKRVY